MRRNTKRLFAAVAAMLWMLLPGVALAESAGDNYHTYCVQCHGLSGKGNGVNIRDMSVQPRDHTGALGMGGLSDAHMFKAIKEGGAAVTKSTLMPPWSGVLTDEEIHDLVRYLRVLCNCEGRG